jgi:hypothetical protein
MRRKGGIMKGLIDVGQMWWTMKLYKPDPGATRSASGYPAEAYVLHNTVKAEKREGVSSEDEEDYQEKETKYVNWRMWYDASVKSDWQLEDEAGVRYNVEGVQEMGYKEAMEVKTLLVQ